MRAFLPGFLSCLLLLGGCDLLSNTTGSNTLSAEIMDGDLVARSRVAVKFVNGSDKTLAYDLCEAGIDSYPRDGDTIRQLLVICDPVPHLWLHEIEAGATVADTFAVPGSVPPGRYRYVFPVYDEQKDSVGEVTTGPVTIEKCEQSRRHNNTL